MSLISWFFSARATGWGLQTLSWNWRLCAVNMSEYPESIPRQCWYWRFTSWYCSNKTNVLVLHRQKPWPPAHKHTWTHTHTDCKSGATKKNGCAGSARHVCRTCLVNIPSFECVFVWFLGVSMVSHSFSWTNPTASTKSFFWGGIHPCQHTGVGKYQSGSDSVQQDRVHWHKWG